MMDVAKLIASFLTPIIIFLHGNIMMDMAKLIASFLTPAIIFLLGIRFLRKIESIKAVVSRQNAFQIKWAEDYFVSCQSFLQTLERFIALLTVISGLEDPDSPYGTELQEEVARLKPSLSELELRIRRSVVFSTIHGMPTTQAASDCLSLIENLLRDRQGNVDMIIEKMNDFNYAFRKSHAEMLGIDTE